MKSRTVDLPVALVLGLVALILCGASIFLPWWRVHDSRVGTTWSILLFMMSKGESSDYVWSITNLELRNTLLGPLALVVAGLMFNGISFKLRGLNLRVILLRRRVWCNLSGLFYLLSGLSSFAAYILFRTGLPPYLESVRQTFSGYKGVLQWGLGLGANFTLAGGVLVCIGGILYLLKAGTVSMEIIVETEELTTNAGEGIN